LSLKGCCCIRLGSHFGTLAFESSTIYTTLSDRSKHCRAVELAASAAKIEDYKEGLESCKTEKEDCSTSRLRTLSLETTTPIRLHLTSSSTRSTQPSHTSMSNPLNHRSTSQPWWKRIYPGVRFTPDQPTTLPHPHHLQPPPPLPWYKRIYPTTPAPHRDHFPPRPILKKVPKSTRIDAWTARHIRPLRAVPNTLATVLWTVMLLYFSIWYTTRKKVPSATPPHAFTLPKPCHAFSLWPYISCVGQHEKLVFRGVCIAMALLIGFSFIQLTRLTAPIKTGRKLRLISTAFAIISSIALVALTYELIDEMPLPHLITASGQIFAMFVCKCFDWAWNLVVRRAWARKMGRWRRVRALEVSRWCKIGVAAWIIGMFFLPYHSREGC